eukprot:Gb_09487 [translate_table: standard]
MVKEGETRFDVQGWAARDESGVLSPFNFTRRFLLTYVTDLRTLSVKNFISGFNLGIQVESVVNSAPKFLCFCRPSCNYWAAAEKSNPNPGETKKRPTGPHDITFEVAYCGICHSDLHLLRNDWKSSTYPMVPGHEIVGIVTEVGKDVKDFIVGDRVGVGCMVGSCHACDFCGTEQEQYCEKAIWTYNSVDIDESSTFGGYSTLMVCNERFVLKVPKNLPFDATAPLLCAGITVYSPLKHFRMTEPGKRLGVVGLGGLGHMAVKFGKAFGLEVTVISMSPNKEKEARQVLGADHFLISKDEKQMQDATKSMDYILDTVSALHPMEPLLNLLKVNGKLVIVGLPQNPVQFAAISVMFGRRFVGGSAIGGIKETQEMLDFCGEHNIYCMIEKIPMDYINTAIRRLEKADVKYRFVIDVVGSFKRNDDEEDVL